MSKLANIMNVYIFIGALFVLNIGYGFLLPSMGILFNYFIPVEYSTERATIMSFSAISFLVSLFLAGLWGNKLLFDLLTIEIFLTIVILVITKFWKISLHAALNTTGALIVNFLFNWNLPVLYLVVPLVVWSRLMLKKHTPEQLVAGVLTSGALTLLSLAYLGYLKA